MPLSCIKPVASKISWPIALTFYKLKFDFLFLQNSYKLESISSKTNATFSILTFILHYDWSQSTSISFIICGCDNDFNAFISLSFLSLSILAQRCFITFKAYLCPSSREVAINTSEQVPSPFLHSTRQFYIINIIKKHPYNSLPLQQIHKTKTNQNKIKRISHTILKRQSQQLYNFNYVSFYNNKQNQLQRAMDSRIYFHQYRRPRCDNPTYKSSNVENSLAFFNGGYSTQRKGYKEQSYPANNYYHQPTSQENNYQAPPTNNYRPQYNQIQVPRHNPPVENIGRQQNSYLSSYGQKSLKLDQREVQNKQSSKFDIINFKPRQYSQDIKQYPWLTVENRDDVYYKRMNQVYNGDINSNQAQRSRRYQKPAPFVAGKHTYDLQPKFTTNPEQPRPPKFTAKMLNHMDELHHNLA